MATVKFQAFEHHKKDNGQINVKLVVYHNQKRAYISTAHNVVEKQLKKDYSFKSLDLIAILTSELATYMKRISELGPTISTMDAKQLGELLMRPADTSMQIDFVAFCRSHIQALKAAGKKSSAGTLQAVVNNLVDFAKSDVIYTNSITSDLLRKYEAYLRKPYTQTRTNQLGKQVTVKQPGMSDAGIFAHMKDFRILYNAAREKYNDLDTGVIRIANYPFKAYKLVPPKDPEPRALPLQLVRQIRDAVLVKGSREEIGRDMFMLSFYMLGMNAVDIYEFTGIVKGRASYSRSKTKEKRSDNAYISVHVPEPAKVLFAKYKPGLLQKRYSKVEQFRKAVALGLTSLAARLEVDKFGFYDARHTVATEARNTLGYSVADVGEALNHKRAESRITDKYIKKDWRLLDEIQERVIALLDAG